MRHMDKTESIITVNNYLGTNTLRNNNTNFSNINIAKDVWWFNIDPNRFKKDLHLILNNPKGFIWIKIPAEKYSSPERVFKIRADKNLVDLEISASPGLSYLRDIKSGGTGFYFKPYIVKIFE